MLLEWFALLLLATLLASALGYPGLAASMVLFIKIALVMIGIIGLAAGSAFLVQLAASPDFAVASMEAAELPVRRPRRA